MVAIGMHSRYLRKDIVAHDRLVGRDGDATVFLYQTSDVVEFVFMDIGERLELVLENHLHTGQRGIAAPLSQAVDSDVHTLGPAEHGSEGVRHCQVVVVVCMEIEMHVGIAFPHLPEELDDLQWVGDAQCVGKHEPQDIGLDEPVHKMVDIIRRVGHAAAPVLQIEIHPHLSAVGIVERPQDIIDMLLWCLVKLLLAMP